MEDPVAVSPLDHRVPNYNRKTANLHYQSELTNEFGTIFIRPETTMDDVMNQYGKLFPKEAQLMTDAIRDLSASLNTPTGMSKEGVVMALTKIPEVVFLAMRFIDPEYWEKKGAMMKFCRKYPKFMVGDHKRKLNPNRGIITK